MASLRTRFPRRSKKTIASGTSVFFIQKPPVVSPGKTKSMPSAGAFRRCMRPRARWSDVRATSGRNGTPSRRSFAVASVRAVAPAAAPARTRALVASTASTIRTATPERYGRKLPLPATGGGHHDRNTLDGVVRVATEIPGRLERLDVPGLVARAAAELVLAGPRVPSEAPATPGPAAERVGLELRLGPGRAAVGRDVHAHDRGDARPGATLHHVLADGYDSRARQELGDPRRDHQRADVDSANRLADLVLIPAEPVGVALLVAVEGLVDHVDAREPLHARHPVPAGNEQPERKAVLRRERHPVHLVREEHVVAERVLERDAARVVLLLAALDAAVEPGEQYLDRAVPDSRLLQQASQRRASPACGPDRLEEPRLAHDVRLNVRAPVAGALHGDGDLGGGAGAQNVERERQPPLDVPADLESPDACIDTGNVVVRQEVVKADRREVEPHRLERHPVIACRELELLAADDGLAHDRRR